MTERENGGTILRRLLSPMEPEEFLRRHWNDRTLHLRADPLRLELLGRFARFAELLHHLRQSEGESAAVTCFVPDGASQLSGGTDTRVPAVEILSSIPADATLSISDVGHRHWLTAEFVARLKEELGYPAPIHARSYRWGGGRGRTLHRIPLGLIVLPLAGDRIWRVGRRPAIPFPTALTYRSESAPVDRDGDDVPVASRGGECDEIQEFSVSPGDLLYVPPGAWQETAPGSSPVSEALFLAFEPTSALDLIMKGLRRALEGRPEWHALPPRVHGNRGGLGSSQIAFLADRISELVTMLRGMDPSGQDLARACASAIAESSGLAFDLACPQERSPASWRLRAAVPASLVRRNEAGREWIDLFLGGHEIEIDDPGLFALFEGMLERRDGFDMESARRWVARDPELAEEMVQELVESGILEPSPEDARVALKTERSR